MTDRVSVSHQDWRRPNVRSRKTLNPSIVRLKPRYCITKSDTTSAPMMKSMRFTPSRPGMKPSGRGSPARRKVMTIWMSDIAISRIPSQKEKNPGPGPKSLP